MCRTLGYSPRPEPILAALSEELDQTYRAVAARLPNNPAVRFERIDGKDELIVSPLDKVEEPASLVALRTAMWCSVSSACSATASVRGSPTSAVPASGGSIPGPTTARLTAWHANPSTSTDKTIHTLTYLDDEAKRRATLIQTEPGRRSPCLGPRRLPRQTWRTAATLP